MNILAQLPKSHPSSIMSSGIICSTTCSVCTANTAPDTQQDNPMLHVELEELCPNVPSKYQDYLHVFSKWQGMTLPPHHAYNHKIETNLGMMPPFGPIYSLSEVRQLALHEFLEENLTNHFIHPLSSPAGTPIHFIQKKDSLLWLAVDYRGLNHITRKDRYPLPLIPNLLDHLCSTHIFSKIDTWGVYNLV